MRLIVIVIIITIAMHLGVRISMNSGPANLVSVTLSITESMPRYYAADHGRHSYQHDHHSVEYDCVHKTGWSCLSSSSRASVLRLPLSWLA